jgi:hypothetical protein
MHTLVYLHGTNGSGKSTLARSVIAAAGGVTEYRPSGKKCGTTHTKSGVALIGRYGNACGGIDGIQPYAQVHNEFLLHSIFPEARVFAEGLVTPGIETCKKFASYFEYTVFILLDTPEDACIRNVLRRRKAKGNTKPYSPDNLYVKARSARSWANNLEASGLEVHRLQYRQAYSLILELLGLPEPSVDDLLL